jgi:anaerobic magnesium-protoporphyrin IX monomethyl ester cyclase
MLQKDVVLIYPYFLTRDADHILFPPLGIAGLTSQLQEAAVDAAIYDCTFKNFETALREIVSLKPKIVGIYIMATMSHNAITLQIKLKELIPEAVFIAGGPLASVYPAKYLRHFDAVFCGEADVHFPRFCSDYLRSKLTLTDFLALVPNSEEGYPGLATIKAGTVQQSPPIHLSTAILNSLPLPDRRQADHHSYQKFWLNKNGTKTTALMTSYGCPHDCNFCSRPIFGRSFRPRSLEKIIEEIHVIRELGYDYLWLADDCFTQNLDFVAAFCQRLHLENLDIKWSCLSRVDSLTPGIVQMMAGAGCAKAYLGLESGDNATLKLMNKHTLVEDGVRAVQLFQDAGIKTAGFFIVGYPGESQTSIDRTLKWALELSMDEISINVPYPLPGSKLYNQVKMLDEADWDKENEIKFIYHSEFDSKKLAAQIAVAMSKFKQSKG